MQPYRDPADAEAEEPELDYVEHRAVGLELDSVEMAERNPQRARTRVRIT